MKHIIEGKTMRHQALKVGDQVSVNLPDGGGYAGEIVGFTPKRIKVKTARATDTVGNYKPQNVSKWVGYFPGDES